jgi:drug/metabolite transporter (DMT)-like permease
MVLATLLWGATFVVVRDSVEIVEPGPLVFLRFGLATLLLIPFLLWHRPPISRSTVVGGAMAGVFAAGGYFFQAIGLTATSAGTSAFLTSTGSLLAAFFAWPLLRQRPSAVVVLGVGLALSGSALLSLRSGFSVGVGEGWTLLGALTYAMQIVVVARFAPVSNPLLLTSVQSFVVMLVLAPYALRGWTHLVRVSSTDSWRLAYLVVAGSMLAPLLQIMAQRTLPPGRIGLLLALEPVFGLMFALSLGGERFQFRWWIGAALILCAVLIVELHANREAELLRRAT